MLGTLFFCFVAFLLVGYVVLDGYDLGTGILHLRLARTDAERRQLLNTIGPLWDGNEVFLIAAGTTLFFAFPTLYAAAFSGFYLPLIIVLWLIMGRDISIDLRSHVASPLWRGFFDVVFFIASGLLAFFLGVALGNVVRGVPIGADRVFFQPLWTDLSLRGTEPGILDLFSVLVGATAVATLALHGATWSALRTTGPVHERARALVVRLWILVGALTAVTTVATWFVQPRVPEAMLGEPWRLVFPLGAIVAFAAVPLMRSRGSDLGAFLATSGFIAAMLASAAFGLYPWMLPSSRGPQYALAIADVATSQSSLRNGAIWWPIGMALGLFYTGYVHLRFSGRERPGA